MAIVTKEELAGRLDGNKYLHEVSEQDCLDAYDSDLLIAFVIRCPDGGFLEFRGVEEQEYYIGQGGQEISAGAVITAKSNQEWEVTANQPYAPFAIVEDGEPYCIGAVVDVSLSNLPENRIPAELAHVLDIAERQSNDPIVTEDLLRAAVDLLRTQGDKIKALEAAKAREPKGLIFRYMARDGDRIRALSVKVTLLEIEHIRPGIGLDGILRARGVDGSMPLVAVELWPPVTAPTPPTA